MNLLSPKTIIVKKNDPFQAAFEISKKLNFMVVEDGVEIQKPMEFLYKSRPVNKYQAVVEAPVVSPDNAESYYKFQSLINHCNNNAETLNNQLRNFLLTVKESKQTPEEIMAMDFMALRNLFSDFFKGYVAIKKQDWCNTPGKIKDITSTFFRYITDRNIYTHGTLKLRFPDEVFVMQYIENKKIKVYAELSIEILKSNLNISNQLMKVITQVSNFYNNVQAII